MSFVTTVESPEDEFFKAFLGSLARNKWIALILFLGLTAGVYLVLLFQPNQYESTALLMVQLGRENSQVPLTVDKASLLSGGVEKEEVNSYVRLLSSRNLIEDVVNVLGTERFARRDTEPTTFLERVKHTARTAVRWVKSSAESAAIAIGLKPELTDRSKAIILLERSLTVARERDSNVIQISLRLPDATLARDAVETLIDLYSSRHLNISEVETVQLAFEFQAVSYKEQLRIKQAEMQDLRREWGITSAEEQRAALVADLVAAESRLRDKLERRAQLQREQQMLERQLAEMPVVRVQQEVVDRNPHADSIRAEIVELTMKRDEESVLFKPDSDTIRIIEQRIAALNSLLEKEAPRVTTGVTTEPNPMVDDLRTRLSHVMVQAEGLDASIAESERQIAQVKDDIDRLNTGAGLLDLVTLEYEILQSKYLSNAERAEQAKIEKELDQRRIANVTVIGKPTLDTDPVAPKRLLLMAVGVVVAAMLSILLPLFKDWFWDRVRAARELPPTASRGVENP